VKIAKIPIASNAIKPKPLCINPNDCQNRHNYPRWIDLTLSAGADVPLLVEGEGQKGEVCHPQLVMLSKAKHPQLDSSLAFGWRVLGTTARPHPVSALLKRPSPCEGEGQKGEVTIFTPAVQTFSKSCIFERHSTLSVNK
jgi:hypothetical protein